MPNERGHKCRRARFGSVDEGVQVFMEKMRRFVDHCSAAGDRGAHPTQRAAFAICIKFDSLISKTCIGAKQFKRDLQAGFAICLQFTFF